MRRTTLLRPIRPALSSIALLAAFCAITGSHAASAQEGDAEVYAALDPRGIRPDIERIPLTERPATLEGKHVYLINSWGGGSDFEGVFVDLKDEIERRYAGATVTIQNRNVGYAEDDPALWALLQENADAFVYAGAPSSSTTSYAFKWSAKLESMGLPGTVLLFDTLTSVGETTRAREGALLRSTAVPFPAETMSAEQKAAALDAVIASLVTPLTDDERATGMIPAPVLPRIVATGTFDEIESYFIDHGLTDGLPIIPPTEDRVTAALTGTSHAADEVVVEDLVPERQRVTVEKVAINAVMAGCSAEHMPVLLATLEAFDEVNLNSAVRSTNPFSFMQVVNGPIRNELGMNTGPWSLGPGNHANACMGRALRLFITNLGGGEPGVNMMGVIGNVSAWPFVLAENEEQSPWESFASAGGYGPEDSTLTLFLGGWAHSGNYGHIDFTLDDVAADIAEFEYTNGAVILMSPKRAEMLSAAGMSKQDVEDYLVEHAVQPLGKVRGARFFQMPPGVRDQPDGTLVQAYAADKVKVIVVGGDASPMMQAWHMARPITVSIDAWR